MPIAQQESRWTGWLVTLGITALGGFLRFWHIGTPREFSFDETYYAKDAWSLVNHGYVTTYVDGADKQILAGHIYDQFTHTASMVVHPQVGKYLIGLSELIFGMNPTGWRIPSAIIGTLMIMVLIRLLRRLTGSMLLAGIGGLLLTFDGLQFVLSRLALLDIFVAFFTLLAVHLLVMDRDWSRERLARAIPVGAAPPRLGPLLLYRPYRLLAGITFGLAVGSKWSALYVLAASGLVVLFWDAGARRAVGVRRWLAKSVLVEAIPAFFYLVVVALVVYVATWTGLIVHYKEYEQALANTQYTEYWGSYVTTQTHGFFPQLLRGLRDLWHFHEAVFNFHTEFLNDATHIYQSSPWGWPILDRPVGVSIQSNIQPGVDGCTAAAGSTCLRQVLLLGTPALWWAGVPALLYGLYSWIARRDWRFGLAVVGFLAAWVPWFQYDQRPIFIFYAIEMLPFTLIALTLTLGRILGAPDAADTRRAWGSAVVGSVVLLVTANFAWFWPIYTDQLLTNAQWLQRIWFRHWI
jgi:dolichyl-phosphate-mannose--protein O-mannosyl transferase